MSLESIIETYGYWALLVGTFLEGETILVLGGFAAHRGYLTLPWVILAAFIGSLCGDQLFFYLGRRHSAFILARFPQWKVSIEKVQGLLERFRTPFILVFRFLYGLRLPAPFAIGMTSVPFKEFVLLNMVGAAVWAILVGVGGYLFGNALEIVIGDVKHYEFEAFGLILLAGATLWIIHFYRSRKHKASSPKMLL